MTMRILPAVAIAAIALSGCGGGNGSPLPHTASPTKSRGALNIVVKVPKAVTTSTHFRTPKYISASTQSITVAIDSGTPTAYGLTATSPGCVAASGSTPLTCTITVSLDAGSHTGTFKTYDGADGTGNLLSSNTDVPLTVDSGVSNSFGLTLNGDIASILLSLANASPREGSATTIALSVNAYDADGNLIIGPGSYDNGPITIADSDTSGATRLSSTSASDPSVSVTVAYNGSLIPGGSATFSATAAGVETTQWRTAVLTPYGANLWDARAAMPTARWFLGSAAINGTVYAVGGVTSIVNGRDMCTNVLEAYDVATNTWSEKSPMPTAVFLNGVAAINGVLYVLGGVDANDDSVATVEAYDPSSDSWTAKSPMPTARAGFGTAVFNGVIYAVGGAQYAGSGPTYLATVEAYDPATDTWTEKAAMPTRIRQLAAAAANGKIYAFGGDSATSGFTNVAEAYDSSVNQWSSIASMQSARYSPAGAAVGSRIYAFGGYRNNTALSTGEVYDSAGGTVWGPIASMPTARYGASAAVVNGQVYVLGGVDAFGGASNANEQYTP